jgi:hypothetical protein
MTLLMHTGAGHATYLCYLANPDQLAAPWMGFRSCGQYAEPFAQALAQLAGILVMF